MKKMLWMMLVLAGGMAAALAATPAGWLDTFDAAQKQAKAQKRPILILFSGSDWCPPCKKLKSDVLDSKEFKKFAKDNVVLLFADFPRSAPTTAEARTLQGKYKISGYPTTVVVAEDGAELGRNVGFAPKTTYINNLKNVVKKAKK